MGKILVSDATAEEGRKILEDGGLNDVVYQPDITPEQLLADIGQYDALVIRSRTQVPAEVLRAGKRLKIVGRAGVGVDNVDIPAATDCGIIVANAPEGNTMTTCEHAISLLMSLVRNVPAADASMRAGAWDKKKFTGVELFGKTLGIIGLGKIGREVAKRMAAFGMTIWGYDPYVSVEVAEKMSVVLKTVPEIIEGADMITIHTPKTAETTNLIGAAELKKMKKTAYLVNCARGGIVNEEALAQALAAGDIAGAAIDVFTSEPLPADHILRKAPRLVLTPHLGASTIEAQEKVATQVAAQVANCLKGAEVTTALNAPSLNAELLKQMGPSLDLAERLGRFVMQMCDARVKKIEVSLSGDVLDYPTTEPIVLSVLKGFLSVISDFPVNFVNARARMKAHGAEIVETRSAQPKDYLRLKTVTATLDNGRTVSASGTVFAPHSARIVAVNHLRFEMRPKGNIILLENDDVPGIIGGVGTTLGKAGINIGEISWGRDEKGGRAMTAINADDPVPAAVLAELGKLPHVVSVRLITL